MRKNLSIVLIDVAVIFGSALSLLFFPASAVASPQPGAGAEAGTTYTVRPGDSLYAISLRFGSTVRAIVEANGLQNPDLIWSGQSLRIPAGPSPANAVSSLAATQGQADAAAQAVSRQERVSPVARAESRPASPDGPPAATMNDREAAMLEGINAQRAAAGLPPLRFEPALVELARARSDDMATRDYFSHTTPEGKQVQDLARAAGLSYPVVSEILARTNYPADKSVEVSITAFMKSDSHRAHVLLPLYNAAAVGQAATSQGMQYYTVVLARSE